MRKLGAALCQPPNKQLQRTVMIKCQDTCGSARPLNCGVRRTMNRLRFAVTLVWLLPVVARAEVPFQPFPEPQVTLEQWTSYHSEVKAAFGESAQERPADRAVMYFDEATLTQYIFTMSSNPAHPGWIARRIVTQGQATFVNQVGYFAGSQELFALWFASYQRENEQLRPSR
jgi:hypothetical protein